MLGHRHAAKRLALEAVADAADCEDCRAAGGVDLAAQTGDVWFEPEEVRVRLRGPAGADEAEVGHEVAAQFDTVAAAAEGCDAPVATGVLPTGGWR